MSKKRYRVTAWNDYNCPDLEDNVYEAETPEEAASLSVAEWTEAIHGLNVYDEDEASMHILCSVDAKAVSIESTESEHLLIVMEDEEDN